MEKNQNKNQDLDFEQVDYENLEELEEVVTPGWGTVGCCTN